MKPKIVIVLGPTASGKSEMAVKIAKRFGGEIVSADSRQVYKGMDIGTGKVPISRKGLPLYKGIRHHLIDVASPKRVFTAARYGKLAERAISEILKRGKLPIICGGTGFYIDVLTGAVTLPLAPPDPALRRELERETSEVLFAKLKKFDPARALKIDSKNKRRLVRALEVVIKTGRSANESCPGKETNYDCLKIGIRMPPEDLKTKIQKRLKARLKDGMIEEVRGLHDGGLSWKKLDGFGLEYRFVSRYLRKVISNEKELAEVLKKEIWRYAKRQMTWFKRDGGIYWVESYGETEKMVRGFLKEAKKV